MTSNSGADGGNIAVKPTGRLTSTDRLLLSS